MHTLTVKVDNIKSKPMNLFLQFTSAEDLWKEMENIKKNGLIYFGDNFISYFGPKEILQILPKSAQI